MDSCLSSHLTSRRRRSSGASSSKLRSGVHAPFLGWKREMGLRQSARRPVMLQSGRATMMKQDATDGAFQRYQRGETLAGFASFGSSGGGSGGWGLRVGSMTTRRVAYWPRLRPRDIPPGPLAASIRNSPRRHRALMAQRRLTSRRASIRREFSLCAATTSATLVAFRVGIPTVRIPSLSGAFGVVVRVLGRGTRPTCPPWSKSIRVTSAE